MVERLAGGGTVLLRRIVIERHQCLLLQAVVGAMSTAEKHHHEKPCETQTYEDGDGKNFHDWGRWMVTKQTSQPDSPQFLP
jgi:hypothetical protein